MTDDKAARLAAIRAANAARAASTDATPTTRPTEVALDEQPPAIALHTLLTALLAIVAGSLVATILLPAWLPNLSASLLGDEPKAYWYLARSSALVAYTLLWLAMLLGLSMTNRLARLWPGGPTAFDLHQHASLMGLGFALFHGLILTGDHYIGYTVSQVLLPFSSNSYRPLWVGLGQIGFYLLALVGLSFYVRGAIGRNAWRAIHFLSFALFLLALAHGLQSGTDSTTSWVQLLYWVSGGSVLFMTIYRIFAVKKATTSAA